MTEDLGTPTRPHALTGEQWRLEVRTDDPVSPSDDERWIRSDLDGGDRVATLKCGDGTEIPLFPTGTAEETVREARRYRVGGQTVYAPLAPVDEAAFPARRVQHDGQIHAFHDRVYPVPAIPDSGVARWEFEQDVADSWGDNDGTDNTSAGYSTDAQVGNYAKAFDGVGDEVNITPFSGFSDFTLTGWFNADDVQNVGAIIALKQNLNHRVRTNSGNLDFVVRDADVGNSVTVSGNISAGTYTFFAATYSSAEDMELFLNDANSQGTTNAPYASSGNEDLVGNSDTNGRYYDGLVDDLRIYSKVLSTTEISNLYNTGSI